jgi:hypothetical protein
MAATLEDHNMTARKTLLTAGILMFLMTSGAVDASSLLVCEGADNNGHGYGHDGWTTTTNLLNDAFDAVEVTQNYEDLDQMLTYDALWLDQRWINGALSSSEIDNLETYVATGRRAVFVGDNHFWADWNNQILSVAGGSFTGGIYTGETAPAIPHPLTANVDLVDVVSAGLADGGISVFDQNFATLWGPNDNLLTILDLSLFTNDDIMDADNHTFVSNTAQWLATPEPGTLALLALGGVLLRRCR